MKQVHSFAYTPKDGSSTWNVTFKSDGTYRDYVLLKQVRPQVQTRRKVPLIMLNPGAFKDVKGYARDFTMRKVREAFLNSGFVVEVLNLYNIAEPNQKKLIAMDDTIRNKDNPLFSVLDTYEKGSKVILQHGKMHDRFKEREREVLEYIDDRGLVPIGLLNNDGTSYRHPRSWILPEVTVKFRDGVLGRL